MGIVEKDQKGRRLTGLSEVVEGNYIYKTGWKRIQREYKVVSIKDLRTDTLCPVIHNVYAYIMYTLCMYYMSRITYLLWSLSCPDVYFGRSVKFDNEDMVG